MVRRWLFFVLFLASLGVALPARAASPYVFGPATGTLLIWKYQIHYYSGTQKVVFNSPVVADQPVSWQTELSRSDQVLVDGRSVPYQVVTDAEGNPSLQATVSGLNPDGGTIEVTTRDAVADEGISSAIDSKQVTADYSSLPDPTPWLSPEKYIESDAPGIVALAQSLKGSETNPYVLAHRAYTWVNQNLTYDDSGNSPYDDQGALSALQHRTGVCLDYASLQVALLRAMGVPSRLVDGVRPPDPIPSAGVDVTPYLHSWTQVYMAPYGWVDIDPTFTDTENGVKVTPDTSFGQFASDDPHMLTDIRVPAAAGQPDGSEAYRVHYVFNDGTPPPDITYSGQLQPYPVPNQSPAPSSGPSTGGFGDVPAGFWASPAITDLTNRGLLQGYPDGTFRPDAPVTRAEMVTLLVRLLKPSSGTLPVFSGFRDVSANYWAYQDILTAQGNGWILGEPDGGFHPDDTLTRGQLATFLVRALGLTDDGRRFSYPDCPPNRWDYLPLNLAWQAGLLQGLDAVTIAPDGPATRAQVAEILERYLQSAPN